MIQRIQAFKTSDGLVWESYNQAINHEFCIDAVKWYKRHPLVVDDYEIPFDNLRMYIRANIDGVQCYFIAPIEKERALLDEDNND